MLFRSTFYAYAETGLDDASGIVIRSPIEKRTFVVDQGSYPLSIFINEVYPSPLKGEEEWVELWNSGDTDVSLAGWQLDDKKNAGSKPWVGDTSALIPAHGYITLPSSVTHLSLNNAGDEVRLLSPDGHTVDFLTYPKIKSGYAYARDFSAQSFCITTMSTPLYLNKCSTQKKIINKGINKKSKHKKISKNTLKTTKKKLITDDSAYAALKDQVLFTSSGITLTNSSYTYSKPYKYTILGLMSTVLLLTFAFYIEKMRKK